MQIKFCLSTVFTGTTIINYIQLPSSFDLVRKCWEKKCFSKVHCIINSYGISQVSELLNLYNRINIYLKTCIHVVQFKKVRYNYWSPWYLYLTFWKTSKNSCNQTVKMIFISNNKFCKCLILFSVTYSNAQLTLIAQVLFLSALNRWIQKALRNPR